MTLRPDITRFHIFSFQLRKNSIVKHYFECRVYSIANSSLFAREIQKLLNILGQLRADGFEPAMAKRWGYLEVLYINAVRESFERAAAASGGGSAKFFAESYEQGVKFVEKTDIGWKVCLE
jgi:hypothetical protein